MRLTNDLSIIQTQINKLLENPDDPHAFEKLARLEAEVADLEMQKRPAEGENIRRRRKADARLRADGAEMRAEPDDFSDEDDGADEANNSETDADDEEEEEAKGNVAKRHKFQAQVDRYAAENKIPKSKAMQLARQAHPDLYRSYVDSGDVSKVSYADLVKRERDRGCSEVAAAQRVAYARPELLRSHIAKSATPVTAFMKIVSDIQKAEGVDRNTAMAKARQADPEAFQRFQEV